jgi:hypothetical protein
MLTLFQKYYKEFKENAKDFIKNIEQESLETKEAFSLIVDSVKNGKELTQEEKEQIGEQLKDVLKTTGLVGIALLPGGSVFFILTKYLKLNKYILPSSFQEKENEK